MATRLSAKAAGDTMGHMRLLVVTPWFPSYRAMGSGIFNLRDARLLALDHEVTALHLIRPALMSRSDPGAVAFDDAEFAGLRVVRIPFSLGRPASVLRAARAVRRMAGEAELLHSMAFPALVPVWLSGAWKRIPWIHTEHFSQLLGAAGSPLLAFGIARMQSLFKHPDETVAVSRALAEVMDQRRRGRMTTVIDNAVMVPKHPLRDAEFEPGRVRLIGVGGLVDRKGPLQAVETVIELRRRGVDAELTWVGEGESEELVRRRLTEAGIEDRVRLTGQLSPEALSQELAAAELFLLPVESETFGVAIAEALAHGLPVVTSGTGGHLEFLPAEASRVVTERVPAALANAVQDLMADPSRWRRSRIAAYAAERFAPEGRRKAYLAVYERAMDRE